MADGPEIVFWSWYASMLVRLRSLWTDNRVGESDTLRETEEIVCGLAEIVSICTAVVVLVPLSAIVIKNRIRSSNSACVKPV
jgi:hypothetical protein